MAPDRQQLTPETLVAHAEWLRRLAVYLLHDEVEADDVVQETWEAALRSPPDPARPMRPWLAQVVRNAVHSTRRASARRSTREAAALAAPSGEAPDVVLVRLQLQERLARLMVGLEEPYRTTLVLRFYEGRDASEIGRLSNVPPGTVRWRISEGIRRLRIRLDDADNGSRSWRAVLVPLVTNRPTQASPGSRPTGGSKMLRLSIGAGAVAATGVAFLVSVVGPHMGTRPPSVTSPPGVAMARVTTHQLEEDQMNKESRQHLAIFFGLALPALMAANSPPPSNPKRVDLDFKNADIHNVLRLLSDAARVNIWTAHDVTGEVTIKVKAMPWEEVMARICRDRGLHWQRNDNVVLVSQAELKPPQTYVGKRIDIDFTRDARSVDVREAMATLAHAGQVKIEVADDVHATISMRGRDMPWDQVLDIVLWSQGLHAERHGDVIRVLPGADVIRNER
jgi:RNA polymerase sigma factor (sigma-70 family)